LPDLSSLSAAKLAEELISSNPWRRITAQRLLVEQSARFTPREITSMLAKTHKLPARANVLWALDGLRQLPSEDVEAALRHALAGVREQGLRLAEPFLPLSAELRQTAAALATDPSPRVRFQLALSAGALPAVEAPSILAAILERDANDPWTVTAVLSSARHCSFALVEKLAAAKSPNTGTLTRLGAMIGAKGDSAEVVRLLNLVADGPNEAVAAALLEGVGQGMRNSATPLSGWWAKPPADTEAVITKLRTRFEKAAATVRSETASSPVRVAAAGLLALAPFDLAGPPLSGLLSPATPGDVQADAVRSLAAHTDPSVSSLLLKNWAGHSPAVKREVLDALLARPDRALRLLATIEAKQVSASDLDLARVQQLKTHPNAGVKAKANAVLKATVNADRVKVVAEYAAALELKGDAQKGRGVFKQHCAACHKLDGVGNDVGANLLAALPNKSGEDLLVAVFDPNKEVDPRYVNYQVNTADGRSLSGVIASETPTSVTLRGADGKEDVILRTNLESLRSTRLSLMPEGFEKQLAKQDVADLFAYLRVAK
jgi:putative heme-binding domain-containing protein